MDNKSAITVNELINALDIKDILNLHRSDLYFIPLKASRVNKYKRINLNNPKHLELKNKVEQIEFKKLESKNFVYVLSLKNKIEEVEFQSLENDNPCDDYRNTFLLALLNKYNVNNVQEIGYYCSGYYIFVGYQAKLTLDK